MRIVLAYVDVQEPTIDAVVEACASPRRDGAWIDPAIASAYGRLHQLGWAHSVETWRDGEMLLQSLIDSPEKVERAGRRQMELEKLYMASGGIAGPGSLGE